MVKSGQVYITLGKIGSPYGVHGWLKVCTYTEFGASIFDYNPLYLACENDAWKKIEVEDGRMHGKGVIIKFAGINSPESARLLTGKAIAVTRAQLPELKKDEYYWSDLIGLEVVNKKGEVLGHVIYLMATGSNDVLVIKGTKEYAIPYLPGEVIISVDLEKKEIQVNWELI